MAKELHVIEMQSGSLAVDVNASRLLQAWDAIISSYFPGQRTHHIDENSEASSHGKNSSSSTVLDLKSVKVRGKNSVSDLNFIRSQLCKSSSSLL